MPLSDRAIKAAKSKEKDLKLSDEKGLYLLIKKNGAKLFRFKYRFNGKEKKLSIGPCYEGPHSRTEPNNSTETGSL